MLPLTYMRLKLASIQQRNSCIPVLIHCCSPVLPGKLRAMQLHPKHAARLLIQYACVLSSLLHACLSARLHVWHVGRVVGISHFTPPLSDQSGGWCRRFTGRGECCVQRRSGVMCEPCSAAVIRASCWVMASHWSPESSDPESRELLFCWQVKLVCKVTG